MNQITYSNKGRFIKATLRDDTDESVWNEIFKYKEYHRADEVIINAKHPIIDVGAHAGFFSLYVYLLNSLVDIYALEPEPKNLQALAENLKLNSIKNIVIIPKALARKSQPRLLALMTDNHNHYLADEDEELEQGMSVDAISLTDLYKIYNLKQISLLKMDIEGGEYEIIANLNKNDYNIIENIIMEYHNYDNRNYQEIEQTLRQNGFGVQIFPSKFDKTMGFLFGHNKRK